MKSYNILWYHATVPRKHREAQNGHKSVVLWFTGQSGAGKSTLAHAVEEELHKAGVIVLTAFISPNRASRNRVRGMFSPPGEFLKVLCDCPLEVCEQRNVKEIYRVE